MTLKKSNLLSIALLAAFAAMTSSHRAQADDKKLTPVRLQLPWVMLGAYDPFALALQRGYYRDEGIDLTMNEGNSSLVAAQAVATGSTDFAYADAGTGATLISKGAKMKFVAVFQRKSALGLIYHPSIDIKSFADIKGHNVIHGANDAPTQMFVALLKKNNMEWSNVKSTILSPSSYAQSFLQDPDAILLGNTYSTFQSIKVKEPGAKLHFFADFGVNLMSSAVLASDRTIQEKPELVRGFLAATVKGFADSIKDPDAAVDAAAKLFPMAVQSKKAINKSELMAALEILDTPETAGKPLGWTSDAQWANLIELLRTYAEMKTDLASNAYFTNDFLPK